MGRPSRVVRYRPVGIVIVPGTHFLQAQLGVMLRGKLGVGPQALVAGPQLRQHGWVWFANGFW